MYKDLNPNDNLAANGRPHERGGVYVSDFGLATTMRQEGPSPLASDNTLAGNLAYPSPEQAGCINRRVDYRTVSRLVRC